MGDEGQKTRIVKMKMKGLGKMAFRTPVSSLVVYEEPLQKRMQHISWGVTGHAMLWGIFRSMDALYPIQTTVESWMTHPIWMDAGLGASVMILGMTALYSKVSKRPRFFECQ